MACKKPEGFFEGLVHDATLYSAVQASKDSNGKPDPYKAGHGSRNGTHLELR